MLNIITFKKKFLNVCLDDCKQLFKIKILDLKLKTKMHEVGSRGNNDYAKLAS